MLSKSKYIRGLNCPKSLWLYVHKNDERLISEASQFVLSRGTSAGELACEYFPNGKMAVLEDYPCIESALRTQEFIRQGVETIYEELEDVFLMHFNRDYVRRGNLEVNKLFFPESVLSQIRPLQLDISPNLQALQQMLENVEPNIAMGAQCTTPFSCDFSTYCSSLVPAIEVEIKALSNIPEVRESEVRAFVKMVQYPLCHLDFETIMPGIPMFDKSRPYQQTPFQYSLHSQEFKDGEITHTSYLAESNPLVDPRKALIEQMIAETKNAKTIFVYYIPFERTRINEMIRDFPEYAEELKLIVGKLVDLIIPFKKRFYRTETMKGSSSIKKVLPALIPELSYDELEIGEGMSASNAFLDLYYCDNEEVLSKTRQNLLEYCHLDTLAMVKIFEVLKGV